MVTVWEVESLQKKKTIPVYEVSAIFGTVYHLKYWGAVPCIMINMFTEVWFYIL